MRLRGACHEEDSKIPDCEIGCFEAQESFDAEKYPVLTLSVECNVSGVEKLQIIVAGVGAAVQHQQRISVAAITEPGQSESRALQKSSMKKVGSTAGCHCQRTYSKADKEIN